MMSIIDKYYSLRDYSGSPDDEYAQFIIGLYSQLGTEIFALLEESEKMDKKIRIKEDISIEFLDEYSLDILTLD